ncbi:MAG: hypothetical protein WDN03_13500 [Rhizomicrobium sp.]
MLAPVLAHDLVDAAQGVGGLEISGAELLGVAAKDQSGGAALFDARHFRAVGRNSRCPQLGKIVQHDAERGDIVRLAGRNGSRIAAQFEAFLEVAVTLINDRVCRHFPIPPDAFPNTSAVLNNIVPVHANPDPPMSGRSAARRLCT